MKKQNKGKKFPRVEQVGANRYVIISRSHGRTCRTNVHGDALKKVIEKRAKRFPKEYAALL